MVFLTMPAAYIDSHTRPYIYPKSKNLISEASLRLLCRSASPSRKCFESEDSNV